MQRQGGGGGLAGGIADGLVVSGAGTPKNQTERDAKNAKDFEDTPLVRGAKSVGNTIKSWFDGSKSDAVKIADIPKSNRPGVYDNALNFGSGKSDSAPSPKTARISMDGVDPKTLRPPRAMANGGMVVDTLPKPRDPRHYGK